MNPNDDKNREMVEELTRRTGLSYFAIDELLEAGWCYQETLGQTPRWVQQYKNIVVRKDTE